MFQEEPPACPTHPLFSRLPLPCLRCTALACRCAAVVPRHVAAHLSRADQAARREAGAIPAAAATRPLAAAAGRIPGPPFAFPKCRHSPWLLLWWGWVGGGVGGACWCALWRRFSNHMGGVAVRQGEAGRSGYGMHPAAHHWPQMGGERGVGSRVLTAVPPPSIPAWRGAAGT